jgi:GNAT superfamily N-acetyltransferase
MPERFEWKPLTPDTWADFELLFGATGACGGCWCMWWRLPRSQFNKQKGAANREAMKALVDSGQVPGILAFVDGAVAGWCSVAPREEFPGLSRSRTLQPIDDQPVWSVVCLFVRREYRRQGLSVRMLKAAAEYVRSRGGRLVEGYAVDPKGPNAAAPFIWTGVTSAFQQAGFREVARPGARRIMRKALKGR